MTKSKKNLIIIFKICITTIFIYWLVTISDLDALYQNLRSIQPVHIIGATVLHVLAFILGSVRWWLLLGRAGIRVKYSKILPSYYLGIFFNNILPTSVGGDVLRTVHLNLKGLAARSLVGSLIIDRTIGIAVVFVIGATFLSLSDELRLPAISKVMPVLMFALVVSIAMVLLSRRFNALIKRLTDKYERTRFRRFVLDILALCHSYRYALGTVASAIVISVLLQSLVVLSYYVLGAGIGIDLSLITYFAVIPLIFLASSLPISIGGLGVREGTLVGLLIAASADEQRAIALSLLYLIVLWISSLPGAVVMPTTVLNKNQINTWRRPLATDSASSAIDPIKKKSQR